MSTSILDYSHFNHQLKIYMDERLLIVQDSSLSDEEKKTKLALLSDANDELNQSLDIFERMIDALSIDQYLYLLENKIDISALLPYAKKSDLTSYAKKTDLTSYAKKADLAILPTLQTLDNYPTKTFLQATLDTYVPSSQIAIDMAKKASLSFLNGNFPRKSALDAFATKSSLNDYLKKIDSPDGVDLSLYVKKGVKLPVSINLPAVTISTIPLSYVVTGDYVHVFGYIKYVNSGVAFTLPSSLFPPNYVNYLYVIKSNDDNEVRKIKIVNGEFTFSASSYEDKFILDFRLYVGV